MPNCTISFARFLARPKRETLRVTTASAKRDSQGRFQKRAKPETDDKPTKREKQ
jgi:hypothetical protein